MRIDYQKLDEKIWTLLGAWENIEPKPGYIARIKARIAARLTWQEKLQQALETLFPKTVLRKAFVLSLGLVMLSISVPLYANHQTTKTFLANVPEQEWELLANYEAISNLDIMRQATQDQLL